MEGVRYLGLLRGINVGGNNIIKMTDLRSCFEGMGFTDVLTYIQSGNVLFDSEERDKIKLQDKIEKVLSDRFNYSSRIVVVSHQHLKKIVDKAPSGFGEEPDKYRYDVLFIKEPLTPDEIVKDLRIKEGVDRAYAGESVLYFSRLIIRTSQSHLIKVITLPIYKFITIRNWKTTTRVLSLMGK